MFERMGRVAAPAGCALFLLLAVVASGRSPVVTATVAGAVLALVVVAGWRRLSGWPLLAVLLLATAGIVLLAHGNSSNLGWFTLCIVAGWLMLTSSGLVTAVGVVLLLGIFLEEAIALSEEPGWVAWVAGLLFTVVATGFVRRERQLMDQLRAAQAGLAERARAEERNRVAGEIHDSIGHGLTVAVLHISSARLALEDDPEEAAQALAEAERLARESLQEVRTTVGLVRHPDAASPAPTGADLPELVDSFRRAGTNVELDLRGDLSGVGLARGLALYRIVQESLTNAARHGDGSRVLVQVSVEPAQTRVLVLSGGRGEPRVGEGIGLVGMRERAEAVGGNISYAAAPTGWRVEAVLPR